MGESACWLHLTCRACGRVPDQLDADGHCPSCRAATEADAPARTDEQSDGPAGTTSARPPMDRTTTDGDPTDV